MFTKKLYTLLTAIALFALVITAAALYYNYQQDKPLPGHVYGTFKPPPPYTKLLIIAPHCDDETLGAAGLIQQVIAGGGQVKIIIITNGDGFKFATQEEFHHLYASHEDYIRSGYDRQQESLRAAALLGVPGQNVIFLGYPDRGLERMWDEYWLPTAPYTSPYTGTSRSPYNNSYQPQAPYAGQELFDNLTKIISDYQPTMIIIPHPNDEHPDHWSASAFATTVITYLQYQDKLSSQPAVYTYLIHRGDYPVPHGLMPAAPLFPPMALARLGIDWQLAELSPAMRVLKANAIQEYTSQIHVPLLSDLMASFIRTNELYGEMPVQILTPISSAVNLSALESWNKATPLLTNPASDTFFRFLESSANILAIYTYLQDNNLWVRLQLRGGIQHSIGYDLTIIGFAVQPEGLQRTHQALLTGAKQSYPPGVQITEHTRDIIYKIPLPDIGHPDFLYLQATSTDQFGLHIDRTAWRLVVVNPH